MKPKRHLALLLCLAVITTAWAASINEKQALAMASEFMASRSMPSAGLKMAGKAPLLGATGSQAAYYVFNNGTASGYVIVAGDDRAPAVLGYSDTGTFDVQQVPEAMQELLDGYAAQIEALDQGAVAAPQLTSRGPIAPLLTACWTQGTPYNLLLPHVDGSDYAHAYVGCVATAMAQVMYYWKWPQGATTSIPAYVSSTNSISMPALAPVTFDWGLMQDTYMSDDTTSASAQAVAVLSKYCAQSVEMDFMKSASGAKTVNIARALTHYFGYKGTTQLLSRSNYSTQGWADVIYSELAAGRPVLYAGHKSSSGHAFVCDGYDGNGMFHINWGWNGNSNGYFLLNVLNPDIQGVGSAAGAYGYVYSQVIITGVEPDYEGGSTNFEFAVTVENATLDSYTASRSSANGNFSATVSARFFNYTTETLSMQYGWGLYQGGTLLSNLWSSYYDGVPTNYYMNAASKVLNFGSGLADGTYRLVPICSPMYGSDWRPCLGADRHYIEVVIGGNQCTFTGYGTAGDINYTVNGITIDGLMHPGRPIDINVNLTNNGHCSNNLLHMFVDGTFTASSYVGLETGETGDIPFSYAPDAAGQHTLTFSFSKDGTDPIATRTITVVEMPAASLSAAITVLNVTDNANKVITDDKFSIEVTITNDGTTTYDEDFYVKLCKSTSSGYGTAVQGKTQRLTLAPGQSTTLQFDMDNVINNWQYFIWTYYYSSGDEVRLRGTGVYTIVIPEKPVNTLGDVNGDGQVNITDATLLTSYLMNNGGSTIVEANADMNHDGDLNITDLTLLISQLLNATD